MPPSLYEEAEEGTEARWFEKFVINRMEMLSRLFTRSLSPSSHVGDNTVSISNTSLHSLSGYGLWTALSDIANRGRIF